MGGTLKAKMYATPIHRARNGKRQEGQEFKCARCPSNVVRAMRWAERMPTMAVIGAARELERVEQRMPSRSSEQPPVRPVINREGLDEMVQREGVIASPHF